MLNELVHNLISRNEKLYVGLVLKYFSSVWQFNYQIVKKFPFVFLT